MEHQFYRPTVISLFAGCGGSALGYKNAGFKSIAEIDFDKHAINTLKANFPDSLILHEDVTKIDWSSVLSQCDIKPGELDVLDGSPPCQGFSTAGRRDVNDPKNQLFKAYVKAIRAMKPKVIVMENVEGMIRGKMLKCGFAHLITKEIKDSGYNVKLHLLNAAEYGVPQTRKRLIWIGVRNDFNIDPSFPKPENSTVSVCDVLPYIRAFSPNQFQDEKVLSIHPCCTITRGGIKVYEKDGFGRQATTQELKVLSSFPESFIFPDDERSKTHARNQIGNCVPPLLIEKIARNIYENVLSKISA
jgi:DNA (cytosine-5)-methyltransferase 1